MAITNYFYNATTKKYIALFGSIFNKLSITRADAEGYDVHSMVVPINYGPYQKFLARLEQDPNLDAKPAITLPRMAFELLAITYDGPRKVGSLKKLIPNAGETFQYAPAPYTLDFNLYVMTKYAEDAVQIVEQILPFFKPERTLSVEMIEGLDPIDIPIVLTSVISEDLYEADFLTRRSIMWTLSFSLKGYYFGPVREGNRIKFMDIQYFTKLPEDYTDDPDYEVRATTQPGLTSDGEPTTDINHTVPYDGIEVDDDWGIIHMIEEDYDNG